VADSTTAKLVILDRDGVINRDSKDFVKTAEEWIPLPGSIDAIADLSRAGYAIAVASNQSGLARGLFKQAELDEMHEKLRGLVANAGGRIDHIAICPHGPDEECDCRKPAPGLYRQIAEHFAVDLAGVLAIGDSLRDLEAAASAGATPVLVRTGNGQETETQLSVAFESVARFDDLAAAARSILQET
jgi:D-glycero-D-manno-heptose 1,7-bisphosphate phosphatase